MPVNDDIREQLGKVKGKGFKYVAAYFWEYYKWPTLAIFVALFVVISLIKTFVTAKDTAFQAVFISSQQALDATEFTERIGVDTKDYEVLFDANYSLNLDPDSYDESSYISLQKIMAMVTAKQLDVIISYETIAEYYGKGEMFMDLRLMFGDEMIEKLGDKVLWVDTVDEDGNVKDHIPAAINISDAKKIKDNQCFPYGDAYMGIVANTIHPDYIKEFYTYIYE